MLLTRICKYSELISYENINGILIPVYLPELPDELACNWLEVSDWLATLS
jgi:hypothetical protein